MSNIGHWVTGIALIKGRDTCGVVIGFRSRSMHRDLIPRCFSHIDFQNVFSSRKGKFSSCRSFITKENIIISRFYFPEVLSKILRQWDFKRKMFSQEGELSRCGTAYKFCRYNIFNVSPFTAIYFVYVGWSLVKYLTTTEFCHKFCYKPICFLEIKSQTRKLDVVM